MTPREVGPLVARGRDGDVFEYGPGLVLRRTRDGRNLEHEARVMRFAADHGYPVPAVEDVRADGSEIVMERIEGPMMMDAIARRPWRMPAYASLLADLHDELHRLVAPEWIAPLSDDGDRLLHLDLHPMNVMLSSRGPVVIDWTNAARGAPLADAALTYVLLTCPEMPGPRPLQVAVTPLRNYLAMAFARRYRGSAFDVQLAFTAELKSLDRNMGPGEIDACLRLAARARRRADA